MQADPLIARLRDELTQRHGAHTILLYGSHADGSASPASDYDLAGFADVPRTLRDARVVQGRYLDAFIYPEALLSQPTVENLHMRGAVVLTQRGELATQFLAKLDALHAAGPEPKPEDELQAVRTWAWKMLARLERGDVEGNYRRHWLLMALLEDYYLLRHQWYLGPKKSLLALQQADPPTYAAFDAALRPDAQVQALRHLVRLVAGEATHDTGA